MGSIRAKCDKLFFDFRYQGVRCREHTKLPDTKANRKLMQRVLDKIEAQILDGSFDYAHCFPGSHNADKFSPAQHTTRVVAPQAPVADTPLYKDFAETWYRECEPLWHRSHQATLRSSLDRHLISAFGTQPIGSVSKADCLEFRARLAKLPGRMGGTRCQPRPSTGSSRSTASCSAKPQNDLGSSTRSAG